MGYQTRDFYDVDAAVDRLGEQIDRERAVDVVCEEVAKHAAILRQRAADEAEAVRRMATSRRVEGYRLFIDVLSRRHRFTISATRRPSDSASANWSTRTIYIHPVTDEWTFAEALHEVGHLLSGKCPGVEPHRRDLSERTFWNCQACEVAAWNMAWKIAPVLDRAMHDRLAQCLRTYRSTPAPARIVRELDRLASSTGYIETHVERWRQQTFRQKQQLVEASLRNERKRWGSR